jgi:hypothetical protein
MGEKRNAYRLLVGKPKGEKPLGRPRRRWVDNMKVDLLEIGWGGVGWIGLAQDRDKWRALVKAANVTAACSFLDWYCDAAMHVFNYRVNY